MFSFSTGLSALRANTVALDVVAHNIANANTQGYHRQEVLFAERGPSWRFGHQIGQGVDVAEIRRAYDEAAARSINRNIADSSAIAAQLQIATDIESLLTPGQGSISDRLESLFNDLESLTAHPEDAGARTVVIQTASSLADEINNLSGQLRSLLTRLDKDIVTSLTEIRQISAELVKVNTEIRDAEWKGLSPSNLWNQRDLLVNKLSEQIDVRMDRQPSAPEASYSNTVFRLADGQLAFSAEAVELIADTTGPETRIIRSGSSTPLSIEGGKLGGLLAARNEIVPHVISRIDAFAQSLLTALDTAHATGMGINGAFAALLGERGVSNITNPLATADTYLPLQTGSLFVTVTDASGVRTLHEITVDPTVHSLADIADSISAIDHMQAVTDPQSDRLTILAEPGFTFDFTGSLATTAAADDLTGTTRPTFTGIYTGQDNDEFTFEFSADGTVGVSDGLHLEVRDAQGGLVKTLDVGASYEPGTELSIADGVSVRLTPGTANAGDSFSTIVVARPDETGILAALGLNTLFSGDLATGVRVSSALLDDSNRLATSLTGQALDSRNAQEMEKLRNAALMADGSQTFETYLAHTVASIGAESATLAQIQDNLDTIRVSLEAERQTVSGVDPNEEIVFMLQYQRAFQAAARYVAAIDTTLEELFNILR